jgi:competence protein ComEC
MRDRWVVALAAAAAAGALRPSAVPLGLALALVGGALVARRPLLLCLGVAVLTSSLAQRAEDGLRGLRAAPVDAVVTLVTDPQPSAGGWRADARLGHHRVELDARGTTAASLRPHLAGDRLRVRGALRPEVRPPPWLVVRHVGARLAAVRIEPGPPPAPVAALANGLRRRLAAGAASLGPVRRSLFTGLVLGDDREQPAALADDFRGAGLTHLLAVSGENVAFVVALTGPVARRLRLWPRLGLLLSVIAFFALLTRFEPSVSRAAVMGGLSAITVTIGQPTTRVRVLALAVTALLVVDPLLVRSLGFQLSVAAALAITVGAAPLAGALPGPRWLIEPLAVTIAAQLGVAPLQLAAFGPIPVASVPANLLAVPAAGAVMVWGMTAGVLAGFAGGRAAALLHLPTGLCLGWLASVARRAAAAPLGQLDGRGAALAAVGLALVGLGTRLGRPAARATGAALAAAAVYVAVVLAQAPPGLRDALAPGVVRWHGPGAEVLALGGGGWRSGLDAPSVLAVLRTAHVRSIDVLVVVDARVPASVVAAVGERHPIGRTLVAAGRSPEERPTAAVAVPAAGAQLEVGGLDLLLVPAEDRLVVEAVPAPH